MFFCTQDAADAYDKLQDFIKITFNIDLPNYNLSLTENFFVYFVNDVAVLQDYSLSESFIVDLNNGVPVLHDYPPNINIGIESVVIQFLKDHPRLNEENEIYLKNKENLFSKLFSLEKDDNVDEELQKWSWGAFILGWRLIDNGSHWMWIIRKEYRKFVLVEMLIGFFLPFSVILLLPLMCFWGYNGRKLYWLSKRWSGKKYFQQLQRKRNIAGIIMLILYIALGWFACNGII